MKRVFSAITRASIKFRWITIAIAVISLVGGVWAATRMNQELLPDLSFPQTFIITTSGGRSADDILELVTKPLEAELVKVRGVVPEGLQTTTTGAIAFYQVVYESGINKETFNKDVQAAIDKVTAEGIPANLKTTADLTPENITAVLTKAPSMWKHFQSVHILAMPSAVLDAALKINPEFINTLDRLTRDQIAAERIDAAVNGRQPEKRPANLPNAWVMTDAKKPTIFNFNLADLPVITASISSSKLTAAQLADLVNKELKPELEKLEGVAKNGVRVSGGQEIPPEVMQAAEAAIARKAQESQSTPAVAPTQAATPAAESTPAAQSTPAATPAVPVDANGVPQMPGSWRTFVAAPVLTALLRTPINTADDLFKARTADDKTLTAAEALNLISDKNAVLIRDLSPGIVQYIAGKEPDFVKNLNAKASNALSAAAYAALTGEAVAPTLADAWTPLINRPGYKDVNLATVRDLANLPDGAANALNQIVKNTPADLRAFAVRIVSSLTPDAINWIVKAQPDFLSKLDPAVLRLFSADALKALPADFINGLSDAALKAELQAIIADPTKAAVAQLKEDAGANTIPDDPTAPKVPESWTTQLKGFGVNVVKADDLLRKPFGETAAGFINLLAARGGAAFMSPLNADVLIYVASKDPTFYSTLTPATLGLLNKDQLARLPREVQDRAEVGTPFTPDKTLTRTNGAPSLTVSVNKVTGENTVNVSDRVEHYFTEFKKKYPDIAISYVFEQASFIRESISGVAREGGLGAVMAVIVILLFLNFSFRSTLVTAVSIPTSVGIAFVLMYLLPQGLHPIIRDSSLPEALRTFLLRLFPASITLNIMTLSGLTVAIGRVVDDSIVVLENIYRKVQAGGDPLQAVLIGTRDVSLAIFAATVTTVVVFLPIGLTGGVIGEFFLPFGLAVTYSLLASFVVAITIVPLLAFLFIRPKDVPEEKEGRLEHAYERAIKWSLNHRLIVMVAAFATLVIGVGLFSTRPTTFLPSFGEPQVAITVTLPPGTPMQQTNVYVQRMENYLQSELFGKEIRKYQVNIGGGSGLEAFIGGGGVTGSNATITLVPEVKGDELIRLTEKVRAKAEEIFGKQYAKASKASLSEQGFGGFALVASATDAETLRKFDDEIIKTLGTVPGLSNVNSTLRQAAGAGSAAYLRINQSPAVQYTGELETSDTLGTTRKALAAVRANSNLPQTIIVDEGYQSKTQTQGFSQTFGSLGLAILIVYFVMVFVFGSLIHPFTILFSLPLAVVGAAAGLTLTNRVVGISALIGLLMLVGIVVTNAIVLIDRVQQNRKERHMGARDALIEGGRTRLRPILMTAIATMFALLPLAIGLSEGAIIAAELGTVVIGGLFSSTVLTLLVVPVVYSLFNDVFGGRRGSKVDKAEKAAPEAVPGD
jgi:hydrophobic/amphiphilic exporter-1 (mainly G- bacteria), HAE1 family